MAIRKIVTIDEEKCNGCGECVPNCAEGALQIIDGKARLVSDVYCDGLGACLGHCPMDAITIEERDADEFDEAAVNNRLEQLGRPTLESPATVATPQQQRGMSDVSAHSGAGCPSGNGNHGGGGCPGSRMMDFLAGDAGDNRSDNAPKPSPAASARPTTAQSESGMEAGMGAGMEAGPGESGLGNWPVQLSLLPIEAPFYNDRELVLAADCAAFSMPDFHSRILKGRALAIACPKLDNVEPYVEKLTEILRRNRIRGLLLIHMEVPCCGGIVSLARRAAAACGRPVAVRDIMVGVRGKVLSDELAVYGG